MVSHEITETRRRNVVKSHTGKTAAIAVWLFVAHGGGLMASLPADTPAATTAGGAQSDVSIDTLRCEYLADPLGIDVDRPRLSWVLRSQRRGQRQTAYQVLVASGPERLERNRGDLWDSGRVPSDQSNQVDYAGNPLPSRQRCFWKVRIWDIDAKVSEWSRPAVWSMGLLRPADWQARWITRKDRSGEALPAGGPQDDLYPLAVLRKAFDARRDIRRAEVYVCGLGQYELFLNGEKVGANFLDPAWSVYEKTVYYNTFEITGGLRPGRNAFGIMLGKGFYNTRGDRRIHGVDADRPLMAILQAHITYADGSQQVICSDASWKAADGPLLHCAILGGSDYDARQLDDHWAEADLDETGWQPAQETQAPGGVLAACPAPALRVAERFEPVKIDQQQAGCFVYDFGQNASAKPYLVVQGQPGQKVRLTPAEQRHGQSGVANDGAGRVNQAGVGTPNYWEYTLKRDNQPESWTPPFTYSGYQYLEVEGAVPAGSPNPDHLPVIQQLVSLHVRNASPPAGSFQCSHALFNDTNRLIDWAVRSNLGHVLTDCPHREKLGWLEVSYLMAPSISWNYDIAAFYTKIVRDIQDSQGPDGCIYTVAPNYPRFQGGFRYSPEWAAAGVCVPWHLYRWYGDRRILAQSYPMMTRYVDYLRQSSDNLIAKPGLGDWYDYGHGESLGAGRFTPATLTATATFYGCCRIVADTAGILGRTPDRQKYADLAAQVKAAFNRTFFDGQATYQNHGSPQTAHSLALVLGLVESGREMPILGAIIGDLANRRYQQTAGDVGYHYLVEALEEYGRSDILYKIANRYELGSYGYIIKQGWTSMPEAWDATLSSSMNHCMLGHIQQWFFEGLGGLAPQSAGFRTVLVRPAFLADLQWCDCRHESMYGTIESRWWREGPDIELRIAVPVNATASVSFPTVRADTLSENGAPIDTIAGIRFLKRDGDRLMYEVPSGRYRFRLKGAD
ncbi:MAG: family 78 glycoside hydrolase catalytic domain [Sedimentisphaerales bacterium]|nr:family 78 glycoside hydrolase catalytic domain [Sedimentisphaerales bacterium]